MSTFSSSIQHPASIGTDRICVDALSLSELKKYNKKILKSRYETITKMNHFLVRRSLAVARPDIFFVLPRAPF